MGTAVCMAATHGLGAEGHTVGLKMLHCSAELLLTKDVVHSLPLSLSGCSLGDREGFCAKLSPRSRVK